MGLQIENGVGGSNLAKVNANNRLYVNSISTLENLAATKRGDSYNINTGKITLSDSVDTPVIYVKNNEDRDLHIVALAVGLSTESGSPDVTAMIEITVIRNPKTGTIITSTPTDVDINQNRNFGSTNTLTVDAYKGATGDTMTDGDDYLFLFSPDFGRNFFTIDSILTKGDSIGVKINPTTGSTGLPVYAAFICHLEDPNE